MYVYLNGNPPFLCTVLLVYKLFVQGDACINFCLVPPPPPQGIRLSYKQIINLKPMKICRFFVGI